MIDAKNMWLAMAAFVAVWAGVKAMAPPAADPDGEPYAVVQVGHGSEARLAKLKRPECLGLPDRIWVEHKNGVDCLSVIVPSSLRGDAKQAETAVIFIDGDVPFDQQNATDEERARRSYVAMTDTMSGRFDVPFLVLSRPGILGSTGAHLLGGRRDDAVVLDAAVDQLKRRYGVRRLVLAGQSGGSRLIAQLLVMGRSDINCAVLGSGAYDTPNVSTNIFGEPGRRFLVPMHHVNDVATVRDRRIFVVGDPKDRVTPFPEQKAWADKLAALGHHAVLVATEARGDKNHGAARQSLEAAGLCAKGAPDPAIIAAARKAPD